MVPLIEKKHRILRKCAMSLLGNKLRNFLDVLCSGVIFVLFVVTHIYSVYTSSDDGELIESARHACV